MPYASTIAARKIHEIAQNEGRPVTPLELIKLTYLAHGWSLAFRGRGLVREAAEACAAYHDEMVRNVTASRVRCAEI